MAVRNVPPTGSYNGANDATTRRDRSFAALYEQARRASINDNANDRAAQDRAQAEIQAEENRKYLENLHERVDSLRGEIIVRVIQSAPAQGNDALPAAVDISRLSTRLDSLRQKLRQEENRLSGKLVDVEV